MTTASKFALAYLFVAAVWLIGAERMVSACFPGAAALFCQYRVWMFVAVAAILLYGSVVRESTRRDRVEADLRARAIFDPLTGLLNRACFMEALEKSLAVAARDRQKVGVAFIDLDGFKGINDRLGHQVGDQLLSEIGRRISAVVRSSDCAARLGGDEFAVLIRGERAAGLRRLAQRLAMALRAPFSVMGEEIAVTASIGLALYPDHGLEAPQVLRAADMAMYRVKASGKDGVSSIAGKPRLVPAAAA